MSRTTRSLSATLALLVGSATLTLGGIARAADPTVVTPSDLAGWESTAEGTGTAYGLFVKGPDAPPLGDGSFKQVATTGNKQYLRTAAYNGQSLSGFSLSYSTYSDNTGPQRTYVNIFVDHTGDGINDDTLVFEPSVQVAPEPGDWEAWSETQNGRWRTSAGGPNGPFFTIAEYLAQPGKANAKLATLIKDNHQDAVGFVAGSSGGWPNYDGSIDNVVINEATYDFEPGLTIVSPNALNGWETTKTGTNAVAAFVQGPGAPPLGDGSFHQGTNGAGEFAGIQTAIPAGTPLTNVDLAYSTYAATATSEKPTIKLGVDNDADGFADETLKFQPVYQTGASGTPDQCSAQGGCATAGLWQTWDADAGIWWHKVGGVEAYVTLAQYAANFPDVTVKVAPWGEWLGASLRVEVGSTGAGPASDSNLDNVTINGVTYDMESLVEFFDCGAATDDIGSLQAIIDTIDDGSTIKLKGTCDFSGAAAHGGDSASVANAAILIRSTSPINGLMIESEDAPQSATILGSGTQAAFVVGPQNNNVTIRGLQFVNVARAVVSINNDGTTIGAAGGVPSTAANRILGNATMDSAILGLAVDRGPTIAEAIGTVRVGYGVGAVSSKTFTGQASALLTNYKVLGNYISYNPPAAPAGATETIAIDIRQRSTGEVDGIQITGNAVGMFSSEFPSINMGGIKLHGLLPQAPTGVVDPSDYLIRNVAITGNNLGRLEELRADAGDVHATGRLGMSLVGVSSFLIKDNGVRARLSPTGIPMPGGGIVTSDSGFGKIENNGVIVIADPSTLESDLGAIGVVDELNSIFAGAPKPQVSTTIEIVDNTIGPVGATAPGLGAQRGIVIAGSSNIVAHGNNIKFSSDKAINIAPVVQGPGSVSSPGTLELPKTVTSSVVCLNTLDGAADNAAEVSFGQDGIGNAFPGGATFADQTECVPTLSLSTTVLNAGGGLTTSAKGWSNRPISVSVTDGAPTPNVVTKVGTTAANGAYSIAFSSSELALLFDGNVSVVATSSDPGTGISKASALKSLLKDTGLPSAPVIGSPTEGLTLGSPLVVSGTAQPNMTVRVRKGATVIGSAPSGATGNWSVNVALADGPHSVTADATSSSNNTGPSSALRSFIVDSTLPASPIILAPTVNEVLGSTSVTVSGTSDLGTVVKVREGAVLIGTVTTSGTGTWSVGGLFTEGAHVVSATATDAVNHVSAPATRAFTVQLDTVAPAPPVITFPANNTLVPQFFTVKGTSEAGTIVRLLKGAQEIYRGTTDVNGRWSIVASLSEGIHTMRASAVDPAGNESAVSGPLTVDSDPILPTVSYTTARARIFTPLDTAKLDGTAADNRGIVSLQVQYYDFRGLPAGAPVNATLETPGGTSTGWSAPMTGLAPGSYSAQAVTVDIAGNRSAVASITFIKVP